MKDFIAGASGVLGRRTIKQLTAHGHEVTGIVRSDEKACLVESLGVKPVIGDLFDPTQVRDLVGDAEAVLHLATAILVRARTTLAD